MRRTRLKQGHVCAACREPLGHRPYCSKDHGVYRDSPYRRNSVIGGKYGRNSGQVHTSKSK